MAEDLASLDPETLGFILADWQVWARDDQLPPRVTEAGEDWRVWLILGGRGAGKTRAGAEWVRAKALGIAPLGVEPARRIALVGETLADVRRVMIEGVSGLMAIHGDNERPTLEASKSQLVWPNGAIAQMFSAEDPDSLRGPQFDSAWCAACLERAGLRSTRSLMARSYLKWGEPIKTPRMGAVAVFSRGRDPALGHVGFWLGETDKEVVLLGGNQGDAVSVARYPKSRLLALRWPAREGGVTDESAATTPPANEAEMFERALAHVLKMEGGYTNDPHDPGGPTNMGVTLRVFAAWRKTTLSGTNRARLIRELKRIDRETVREIYKQRYWKVARCGELAPPLAVMQFDTAVNQGPGTAIRILQEAVGTDVDGKIGPRTRAAIARASLSDLLTDYAAIRERRYRALRHFWRFGRGWLRRVKATHKLARAVLDEFPNTPSLQREGEHDMTTAPANETKGKWWGHSMTIWGTIITMLSVVVPAAAPVTGIEVSGDEVRNAGEQTVEALQAVGALVATLITIFGRVRATVPIERALFKSGR